MRMLSRSDLTSTPRFHHWGKLLSQFLSGQICLQLISLATGFLLLHWLSIKDYAQFSVAFAFQSTLNNLVDLGFSGSVIALVGERKTDAKVIGSYIRSAKKLRGRLSVVGIFASCIIFPYLSLRQGWDVLTTFLLLASILGAVLLQSHMVYAAPLLIHGHLKPFYKSQIISSSSRLVLSLFLRFLGMLTAGTAALCATFVTAINGFLYYRNANSLIDEPSTSDHEVSQEMVRYLAPLMPTVIFNALQGQVVMALVTWFGKTANIAEVAALGRLGQLFLVLGAFNSVVVEPYIAGVSASSLRQRYLQILIGATFISICLCILGFTHPQIFIWFLGSNYAKLQLECSWSIASSSVYYLGGVIFTMNCARKWIFWRNTLFEIGLLIALDIICVRFMDLSTTLGVIQFSFITVVGFFFVHLTNGIYGFAIYSKKSKIGSYPL